MNLHEVQAGADFADAEFLGYEKIKSDLTVRISAWNSKLLRIEFKDVLLVCEKGS